MRTMNVGEFKANFSSILKDVLAGEEIGILYGKSKKVVAKLVAQPAEKKQRRKIGILEGRGKVEFAEDFKMTEEDFLNL